MTPKTNTNVLAKKIGFDYQLLIKVKYSTPRHCCGLARKKSKVRDKTVGVREGIGSLQEGGQTVVCIKDR